MHRERVDALPPDRAPLLRRGAGERAPLRRGVPPAYDERLRAACRFAMHLHRPDGQIPALSDSDSGSYADLLQAGRRTPWARPTCVTSRRRVARARPPTERCADFPVGGLPRAAQRVGRPGRPFSDERFLVFGCGPARRRRVTGTTTRWASRPTPTGTRSSSTPAASPTPRARPNWRHWFKGTAAHNTVTVDGLDQQPYRRGKPKGALMSSRLLDRRSTDGLRPPARRGHQPGVRRGAPPGRRVRRRTSTG